MTKIEKVKNVLNLANIDYYAYRAVRVSFYKDKQEILWCISTKEDISSLLEAANISYEIGQRDNLQDMKIYEFIIDDEKEIPELIVTVNTKYECKI